MVSVEKHIQTKEKTFPKKTYLMVKMGQSYFAVQANLPCCAHTPHLYVKVLCEEPTV